MMKAIDQIQIGNVQRKAMDTGAKERLAKMSKDVKSSYTPEETQDLKEQAQGFEAMIINMMLQSMRQTVQEGDLFGDPSAPSNTVYRSMLDNEYSRIMSQSDGLGLSDLIMQHFGVSDTELKVSPASLDTVRQFGDSIDNPATHSSSRFVLPAEGRLTSPFGMRVHPISGRMQMHDGVDMAMPVGTPVKSTASGEVVFAGSKRGYGNTVVIEHPNGYRSLYAHLDSIDVKKGDQVEKSQRIAESGNTGVSTGPHLHFEIQKGGRPCNPIDFVTLP